MLKLMIEKARVDKIVAKLLLSFSTLMKRPFQRVLKFGWGKPVVLGDQAEMKLLIGSFLPFGISIG